MKLFRQAVADINRRWQACQAARASSAHSTNWIVGRSGSVSFNSLTGKPDQTESHG